MHKAFNGLAQTARSPSFPMIPPQVPFKLSSMSFAKYACPVHIIIPPTFHLSLPGNLLLNCIEAFSKLPGTDTVNHFKHSMVIVLKFITGVSTQISLICLSPPVWVEAIINSPLYSLVSMHKKTSFNIR